MTDNPTHTPLPYECFQDRSYYDMWCVRRVNEREWGKGFHLVNGEEAAALRDMLNTRADSHHRLIEALREAASALGIVEAQRKGGLDPILKRAKDNADAALKAVDHG